MKGKKLFEIGIDHAMLAGAKGSFDACLREAVRRAIATGSMEGSANVKISFELFKSVDTDTGEEFLSPDIKFKAGYSVPMKGSLDGNVVEKGRIQPTQDGWILVNDQVSMNELMAEEEPEEYRGEKQLAEVR